MGLAPPQQTSAPVPSWIAQLKVSPAAIADAVPVLPVTEPGGVRCPSTPRPQQATPTTGRADRIAQLCAKPASIAEKDPLGGVACPSSFTPQHTTVRKPARIAQLCEPPAAIADAIPVVAFTEADGVACPSMKL